MDPNDPLGLNSVLGVGQSVATQLGMSWDPNPMHSTVVQGVISGGGTSTSAPAGAPSAGGTPTAPPSALADNKGLLIVAGLGLAYILLKK